MSTVSGRTTASLPVARWRLLVALAVWVLLTAAIALGIDRAPAGILVGAIGALLAYVFVLMRSWVSRLDLFAPYIVFPIFAFAYYGIGSLNVTTYRGEVDVATFALAATGILSFLAGCVSLHFIRACTDTPLDGQDRAVPPWSARRVSHVVALYMAAGTGTVLLACVLYGIPMLNSQIRFEISAYFSFIAELVWIGALMALVFSFDDGIKNKHIVRMLVLAAALVISILGYRTPVAVFFLTAMICYYYKRKPSFRQVAMVMGGILVTISVFWLFRMNVLQESGDEGSLDSIMSRYDAPAWIMPFLTLYLTCREGTAIFDKIREFAPEEGLLHGELLIADMMTILPGEQKSGGALVSDLLGGTGVGGLTPSIFGAFYFDWGLYGMLIAPFLLGVLLTALHMRYRMFSTNLRLVSYAVALTLSIHFIHRGVFAAGYLFVGGMTILAGYLCQRTRSPSEPTPATPRPGD